MESTRWYIAVLVVRSRINYDHKTAPLVDLQFRLIRAGSPEAAYTRALELGRLDEHSYKNADGETVTWDFVGLHDLHEVDDSELSDGVEVYSRIVREDPSLYVVPKERLTVFWVQANKHKTARELLEDK